MRCCGAGRGEPLSAIAADGAPAQTNDQPTVQDGDDEALVFAFGGWQDSHPEAAALEVLMTDRFICLPETPGTAVGLAALHDVFCIGQPFRGGCWGFLVACRGIVATRLQVDTFGEIAQAATRTADEAMPAGKAEGTMGSAGAALVPALGTGEVIFAVIVSVGVGMGSQGSEQVVCHVTP